jgi:hypothetical protein
MPPPSYSGIHTLLLTIESARGLLRSEVLAGSLPARAPDRRAPAFLVGAAIALAQRDGSLRWTQLARRRAEADAGVARLKPCLLCFCS